MKAYKTSMISSYILMTLSFLLLGQFHYHIENTKSDVVRGVCLLVLAVGLVLFLTTEVIFNIFYVKEKELGALKTSVSFGGAGLCLITFLFLIYNTISYAVYLPDYKYALYISGVVLFIAYMIWQKLRLGKHSENTGKAISIISLVIVLLVIACMLMVWLGFEYIIFSSPIKDISIIAQARTYALQYTLEIAKERSLMYAFMTMSLPLFVSVLMNYIELVVKTRRLPVAD